MLRLLRRKVNTHSTILSEKTVIVTGSNTGIGKESARFFVSKGAKVILACRDLEKAKIAAEDIKLHGIGHVEIRRLDLASFKSIHEFAAEILQTEDRIDILVNNAGYWGPKGRTEDGFDLAFGVNHLGPFLLTYLLLDKIKESAPARIINVASKIHEFVKINWKDINYDKRGSYMDWRAYGQSKLCNILFTKELARQLRGKDVNVYCLHPGIINTELFRNFKGLIDFLARIFFSFVSLSVEQGARTTIYCAVSEKVKHQSGLYYEPSARARNSISAKKLWDMSLIMCGLQEDDEINKQDL